MKLSSNPIQVSINNNAIKKVDIDSDGVYDLSISYNYIDLSRANITIKTISEIVPKPVIVNSTQTQTMPVIQNVTNSTQEEVPQKKVSLFSSLNFISYSSKTLLWGAVGFLVLIFVILILMIVSVKRKRTPRFKEHHWKI